jgi:hypothetical protein
MIKLTEEEQIEEFLNSLTDEEYGLIWTCYECIFYDFDAMLEHVNKSDAPELKKDIPSIKRLAEFEKQFQVRLYQLLDIPSMVYEGKKIPMCEWVLLPVSENDKGEVVEVRLGEKEISVLHWRDMLHAGSWEIMKHEILYGDGAGQILALPVIENLRTYEEKHKINLGVLLRECIPLIPIEKTEKKGDK